MSSILRPVSKNGYLQIPCLSSGYPKKNANIHSNVHNKQRAIYQKSKLWAPGSKGHITITFGSAKPDGSPDQAWSLIGVDSNTQSPSMNLGFCDPQYTDFTFNGVTYPASSFVNATRNYCDPSGVASCHVGFTAGCTPVHEFCHMMGALHEHQNNLGKSNPIKLNPEAVINYYTSSGMTKDDAVTNVLNYYTCDEKTGDNCDYIGSKYDNQSIMKYLICDSWLADPSLSNPSEPPIFVLSDTDKLWLAKNYPMSNKNFAELTVEFIDTEDVSWQSAWVQKTIIENLLPLVGIKIRFINTNGTTVTYSPIEHPIVTIGPSPGQSPGPLKIMDHKKVRVGHQLREDYTAWEIAGISFGSFAALISTLICIWALVNLFFK